MDYFEKVRAIVAEQLGVDKEGITMTTRFDELNADSLDVVEVVFALESEFDLQIPDEAVENIKDIGSVVDYISEHV